MSGLDRDIAEGQGADTGGAGAQAPSSPHPDVVVGQGGQREQTIGLFANRPKGQGLTRRARYGRMFEIVSIVRRYEVFRGLTPTSFRHMLEELGPTFVKAGQILSLRSEILPEAFCA